MLLLVSAVTLLLKVLAAYLLYDRFLKLCYIRWFYGRRGMTFMTVIPRPFVGDYYEFVRRAIT